MGIYRLIVIGAGPAGLSCASCFSEGVLLIESRRKPHNHISCAEWVPPFVDAPVIQEIEGMLTIYPGGEVFSPVKGKIIDRKMWQKEWISSLDCLVHTGEKALFVEKGRVVTERAEYKTDWICIASGPGRWIKKDKHKRFLKAVNMRFRLSKPLDHTVVWFHRDIKNGYAWCFPRGDQANVGLGMEGKVSLTIPKVVSFFKTCGYIKGEPLEISGGLIPVDGPDIGDLDGIVFAGDAGGFTDPITGAGIVSALDTGRMAAGLVKGNLTPDRYIKEMGKTHFTFLNRRKSKRKDMEEHWEDLQRVVERDWLSMFQG